MFVTHYSFYSERCNITWKIHLLHVLLNSTNTINKCFQFLRQCQNSDIGKAALLKCTSLEWRIIYAYISPICDRDALIYKICLLQNTISLVKLYVKYIFPNQRYLTEIGKSAQPKVLILNMLQTKHQKWNGNSTYKFSQPRWKQYWKMTKWMFKPFKVTN